MKRRFFVTLQQIMLSVSFLLFNFSPVQALPQNFQDTVIWGGLDVPTAISFAPATNGKVFVAEKAGRIKVFDSLQDTTPTVFADLRSKVQDFGDRGLLGLAVDPQFPDRPYIYALYTMDAPLGSTPPGYNDNCTSPNHCPVGSRLVKLTASASGDTMLSEQILLESWCQIENSHSVGTLFFGNDGALYLSHGDGASYLGVDSGQTGGCQGDPVNEGGALRSQDLRTSGDPVCYNGTLLRVDRDTGAAFPGNPLAGGANAEDDRIISYGFRNPFRFTIDSMTNAVWLADVGWSDWEEVNYIANPTGGVMNFGWPCYEGAARQSGYDAANIPICENLYTSGGVQTPYYSYPHSGTSKAISGVALYRGNNFPAAYNGALFFTDYTQGWIKVIMPGGNGLPNTGNIVNFIPADVFPVDLKVGPNGFLYYVDIGNENIHQVKYFTQNTPPTAKAIANPTFGSLPLTVNFSGSGSSDPDVGDAIQYAWDLDADGAFDDSTAVSPVVTYNQAQTLAVKLRVTDSQAASSIDTVTIYPGNRAPIPNIISPTSTTTFRGGEIIPFSGEANDPDSGTLPASALKWEIILHHCSPDDPDHCHEHQQQVLTGVTSGTFTAPEHEYPAHLEVRLTATDPVTPALTATDNVIVQPQTTTWTFSSDPSGLQLASYGAAETTPFTRTVIVNTQSTISAPVVQQLGASAYEFLSWSDGGTASHNVTSTAAPQTFHATYGPTTLPSVWHSWDVAPQTGSPQGVVISSTNLTASIEFYESTNDFGVTKGSLFNLFTAGAHAETFNNLEKFWSVSGGIAYPYAGKSTVNRGSGVGEGNTQAPVGVKDLQLHPPSNNHNTVAAFKAPQDGTYAISDIGVRRVEAQGGTSRLRVFNAQGTQLAILTATNNQDWVTTGNTFSLSLNAGQYIYFGVDRDSSFSYDATEISWTISATFGNPSPQQPTCTLSPNPTNIQQGASSTLSWTTTNATSFSINQGIGAVAPVGSGSITQSPNSTTTYTGTATGAGGSVQCSATVTVTPTPPQPTCTLSPSPANIQQGASTTLSWTTTNATSFSINQGIGSVTPVGSGSINQSPNITTTYTGTATGAGGSVQCSTTVTVTPAPPTPTCSLSVNPSSITEGGSSTLSWTTQNATGLSIDQGVGSVTPVAGGSRTVSPATTTTYSGTVTGAGGNSSCSTTLTVTAAGQSVKWNSWDVTSQAGSPQGIVTSVTGGITANIEFYESTNDFGVTKGSLFNIYTAGGHAQTFNNVEKFWSLVAGTTAYPYAGKSTVNRGSGAGEGNTPAPLGVRDLQLHPPSNNHNTVAAFKAPLDGTYAISDVGVRRVEAQGGTARLRVFNAQGTQLAILTATNNQDWVTTANTFSLNLTAGQYIYFGVDRDTSFSYDATEISWAISAIFGNPPPQPTCTLSPNPPNIQQGASTTLSWTTTNATAFSINQGIGSVTPIGSGSINQSPGATTTYTGTASGAGGSVQCSTTVTVTTPPPMPTCSLSVNPASIAQGGSSTLSWTTQNATGLSIDQGVGSVTPIAGGSRTVSPATTTTYNGTVIGAGGSSSCSTTLTVTAAGQPLKWNSWDVTPQAGSPQGIVTSATGGVIANIEFYESTNDFGVTKGSLLNIYTSGAHAQTFNNVEKFWSVVAGTTAYPYVGKSTINRGSGAGEGNTPAPLGVRDLQLHPPSNNHNTVAAFKVPQDGTYTIAEIGVRRIEAQGGTSRLRVFNAQGTQLAILTATNNQDWVTTANTFSLNLSAGQSIYFGVDRDSSFSWDATEISWTITKN